MRVEIAKRAARNAERIDRWWREHRDSSDLFAHEFREAIHFLETVADAGTPWQTAMRPRLRRLLLRKTQRHVYFEPFDEGELIQIVAVWGAARERSPIL